MAKETKPVAYRYRYSDPVSGKPVWRYSSGLWNGQHPSESQPLYAAPTPPDAGVKALDLSNLLKHAFSCGYNAAAGDDGWTDYDPDTCPAYARVLSALAPVRVTGEETFQARVQPWMMACFGPEISDDITERNHRFLEESLELVQSTGCTRSEAHQLVDYTFDRPAGETHQEIGGVMVTLAALCLAINEDMAESGETELARIWTKVEKIRAKQAAKPDHSPLPEHVPPSTSPEREALEEAAKDVLAERKRQKSVEGWTSEHDDGHTNGELAKAAVCYAWAAAQSDGLRAVFVTPPPTWPEEWSVEWWKLKDRRRDLVRAGALILAEIERLDRAALRGGE